MDYKKDKRTKNLTLRDIHVGDWVQVWSEQTERYSPPLKIISIHDDGTIYLVTSDDERCTPFEENIKNVDAIQITDDVPDIEECNKVIDWEQRRYEIAKHILPRVFAFGEHKYSAIYAVSYADALIKELKKGGEK